MSNLITITRQQFDEAIAEAMEVGRQEERRRAREVVSNEMTNHPGKVKNYLLYKGWRFDAVKDNGTEYIDNSGSFRVGVPHKLTSASWQRLLLVLAGYYRKTEKQIQSEILGS